MNKTIKIIDTSILLNVLGIPKKSQDKEKVNKDFHEFIDQGCEFILPIAVIIETGNHVAQNGDGNQRRDNAKKFNNFLKESLSGKTPFIIPKKDLLDDMECIKSLLIDFENLAVQEISFGDLMIIHEFRYVSTQFRGMSVDIWTLDEELEKRCKAYSP